MQIKAKYTKNELFNTIKPLYNGNLTIDKALTIFEMEYGYTPEIIENSPKHLTNEHLNNLGYPSFITVEVMEYMKDLQESGVVNMFLSTPYIMERFDYDKNQAKEVLMVYINDYEKLYYPENLI